MKYILLLLFPFYAFAGVTIYPFPAEIAPSPYYEIEVVQQGETYPIKAYVSYAQIPTYNLSKSTSWASFAFTGEITVRVKVLWKSDFEKCKILPSSYNINIDKKVGYWEFRLNQPRKVAIEFDGDITHPLLLFADAPETEVPDKNNPNVIYFEPGVHNMDVIAPKTGQEIYLAPGAYVQGLIKATNVSDVKIYGRGILSGRKFGHTGGRHIIFNGEQSNNIVVKDITIVDSPGFYITTRGNNTRVENVKGIGWWFNTDGIAVGPNGYVNNCFLKCNDDAVKLYHSGTEVHNTTIWQMENGSPFQISWNMPSDNSNFVVKNCDVIHCNHHWDNTNTAVFDAIHGGSGHMSNYLFEDIRIENCDWRLVSIQIMRNKFARSKQLGKISDIHFKNITINTPNGEPLKRVNLIQGNNDISTVENILFENLQINGNYIFTAKQGNFEIEPVTTKNIRFEVNKIETEKTFNNTPAQKKVEYYKNPITKGLNSYGQRDFHILPYNNQYYLVATEKPNPEWGKRGIILYKSAGLTNWHELSYLINKKTVPDTAWYKNQWNAPELHYVNNKFYLTFACRNDISNPYGQLGLALAVANNIEGPYQMLNPEKPLAIGNNFHLFTDNETTFVYWDFDGHIYCAKIDLDNGRLLAQPKKVFKPERMADAPFVLKMPNNKYLMLYSQFKKGYVIGLAESTLPGSPFKAINATLFTRLEDEVETKLNMPYSSGFTFAPPTEITGHVQIITDHFAKQWLVYHSSDKYSEPYLCIEPITITEQGEIIFKGITRTEQTIKW